MLFALLSVAINIVGKCAVISNQNITNPSKDDDKYIVICGINYRFWFNALCFVGSR